MSDVGADTATVIRAALITNRYGGQARDWTDTTTHELRGVSIQPMTADELTVDREYAAAHHRLFSPDADADLLASDRIEWRGDTFEVDGPPGRWYDLDGRPDHLAAALLRITG